MKHFLYLSAVLFLLGGCSHIAPTAIAPSNSFFFSFENDMEGWIANGTDLDDPPIAWSIQQTQEMAKDGNTAIKLFLANYNDKGKIWIERPFEVKPDRPYQANVKYAFASADYGNINLWTIITGVVQQRPQTRNDLVYQEKTGNGSESGIGFKWLEKSYDFNVSSASEGVLYVVIGVWGTWETARTYYLDGVQVTFTEK
jgi:hypothetical protein